MITFQDLARVKALFETLTEDDFLVLIEVFLGSKKHARSTARRQWRSYKADPLEWLVFMESSEFGQALLKTANERLDNRAILIEY